MTANVVLLRAFAGWTVGLVLIFVAWFPPREKHWTSRWLFPMIGVIGWFLAMVGALVAGETIVKHYLNRWLADQSAIVEIAVVVAVVVGFIYATAMASQVIANVARRIKGQKPKPLEWIRHQPRRKRSKTKT